MLGEGISFGTAGDALGAQGTKKRAPSSIEQGASADGVYKEQRSNGGRKSGLPDGGEQASRRQHGLDRSPR